MIRISKPTLARATFASVALVVGAGIYFLDRQPDSVYFLADWWAWSGSTSRFFGTLGNQLPTFIHPFAFILLTAVIVSPSCRHAVAICLLWLFIDSFFEVCQVPAIAQGIANQVPEWFAGVPVLENTSNYFLSGTFDVLDLIAIAVGALAAYLILVASVGEEAKHASDIQTQ